MFSFKQRQEDMAEHRAARKEALEQRHEDLKDREFLKQENLKIRIEAQRNRQEDVQRADEIKDHAQAVEIYNLLSNAWNQSAKNND